MKPSFVLILLLVQLWAVQANDDLNNDSNDDSEDDSEDDSDDDTRFQGEPGPMPNNEPRYLVKIKVYSKHHAETPMRECAGVVLSTTAVLTTSICVNDAGKIEVIRSSTLAISMEGVSMQPDTQVVQAQEVIPHPDFYFNTLENDLAIIKVTPKFRGFDIAIELPRAKGIGKDDITKNAIVEKSGTVGVHNVTVFGWSQGSMMSFTNVTGVYKQVDCNKLYKTNYFIAVPPNVICVNFTENGAFCNFPTGHTDSGSPMVGMIGTKFKRPPFFSLLALATANANASPGCTTSNPTLFTRVDPYIAWIEKTAGIKTPSYS